MEKIIFELIPPPLHWDEKKSKQYLLEACQILDEEKILTVTVPQIIEETRDPTKTHQFVPKMDHLEFIALLKKQKPDLVLIPCKISVIESKVHFRDWMERAYNLGIHHLVLVGGDRTDADYPGYTVCEAAQFVKERYPTIRLGGITIFERDLEEERIQKKIEAGIDFFLSQIIFDTEKMENCLRHVKNIPLYLSLAYPTKPQDVDLVKWLGAHVPQKTEALFKEDLERNSILVMDALLDDIFFFLKNTKQDIGFNVEPLTYHNLEASRNLYQKLKDRIAHI